MSGKVSLFDNCKSVVVPFLDLESSRRCLDAAVSTGGQVHVLHAMVPFASSYPIDVFSVDTQQDIKERSYQDLQRQLKEAGYDVKLHLEYGEPAHIVAQLCEEVGADLIIMESAQRKGIARWFLGSVSEHLVREAPCPLLVLPKVRE